MLSDALAAKRTCNVQGQATSLPTKQIGPVAIECSDNCACLTLTPAPVVDYDHLLNSSMSLHAACPHDTRGSRWNNIAHLDNDVLLAALFGLCITPRVDAQQCSHLSLSHGLQSSSRDCVLLGS